RSRYTQTRTGGEEEGRNGGAGVDERRKGGAEEKERRREPPFLPSSLPPFLSSIPSLLRSSSPRRCSVLRLTGIDLVNPGQNPPREVHGAVVAGILQDADGFRAAAAHLAVHHDVAVAR